MKRIVVSCILSIILILAMTGCKSENAVEENLSSRMIEKDFSNLAFKISIPENYFIAANTDTLVKIMPRSEEYSISVYKYYSPSDGGYPDFSDWPEEDRNMKLELYKGSTQGYYSEYKCDFNAVETINVGDRMALHYYYDGQLSEELINDVEYEGLPLSFTEDMYIFSDYGHIYVVIARIENSEFTSDDVTLIKEIMNSIVIY